MTAFTICQKCEKVSEVMDEELSDYLNLTAEKLGLSAPKTHIEFHGLCNSCFRHNNNGDKEFILFQF